MGKTDPSKPYVPPLCVARAKVDTETNMNPDQIRHFAAPVPVVGPRRVLVVDDHLLIREAVAALLKAEYPRIEVVGTAGDGSTALRVVRDAAPDVVVLDLYLGDEYGLDLIPAISQQPGVAVIILTSSDDPLDQSRALAAGVAAYVSKLSPAGELIAAVLAALPGSGQEVCHDETGCLDRPNRLKPPLPPGMTLD